MANNDVVFMPTNRRVRLEFNGRIVIDSTRAMLLMEGGLHPAYFFPKEDVPAVLLKKSPETKSSPYLGEARSWSLTDGERLATNAVWAFESPPPGMPPVARYVTVAWDTGRWFEEDKEIFGHARNPFRRVDCIKSTRRVEVFLGGQRVADSRRAVFLFETGMIPRYYIPKDDVAPNVTLIPTDKHTYCPYKGTASYYSAVLDGTTYENIVWYYPEPVPESSRIAGLVAFYNEKVDEILLDGAPAPKMA